MVCQRNLVRVMVCTVLLMIVLFSSGTQSQPALANEPIGIKVNGIDLQSEVPPVNRQGYLLVPMRVIFEAIHADVSWDAASRTAYAKRQGSDIEITLDSHVAFVNGRPKPMAVPAELIDQRTMVPLRFVSENLDGLVEWDDENQVALISFTDVTNVTDSVADAADISEGVLPSDEDDMEHPETPRSKQAIIKNWQQYAPSYIGNPYLEAPQTAAPYRIGELHPRYLQDGLNTVNFIRFLADLPYDLELIPALNEQAQHGAVLLAAHGTLTHYPDQPKDMSKDFYDKGYASTTTSNIAEYSLSAYNLEWKDHDHENPTDDVTLTQTVQSYMKDEDPFNLPQVGHRRWILNPSLKSIGFGYAHQLIKKDNNLELNRYSTMQVISNQDLSREEEVDYEFIAWPAEGYFPVEFFTATEERGSDPWSVTLNPKVFVEPKLEDIQVTLTRLADGTSWELGKQHYRTFTEEEYAYSSSFTDAYFNVDNQGFGVNNAIIFRPDISSPYQSEDQYKVEITGLETLLNEPVTIDYTTHFFSINEGN